MQTSLPSGAKAGKALLPVLFPVSFSTSALPHSSDPELPSASHRSGLIPADPNIVQHAEPHRLSKVDMRAPKWSNDVMRNWANDRQCRKRL